MGKHCNVARRAEVVITPYRDGPLLVRGPARLVDASGREVAHRRAPVALCRCGKSRLRPFCDGTHRLIGFRAPGAPELAGRERVSDVEAVIVEISEQRSAVVRPAAQEV
ncbi:MAG TPA: CDGSH iron-sulfur domain-containing protein [Solirubrobacteraceae bacterium]